MTNTDAYNAGRAAGIRAAAEVAEDWYHRSGKGTPYAEILALLDAPAPAGVTVEDEIFTPISDEEAKTLREIAHAADIRHAARVVVEAYDSGKIRSFGPDALRALSEGRT